jgi:hypothetical protein
MKYIEMAWPTLESSGFSPGVSQRELGELESRLAEIVLLCL